MKGDAKIRFQNAFGENPRKWKFLQKIIKNVNKTFLPWLGIEEIVSYAKTHVKPVVAAAAAKSPTKPATTKPLATKLAAAKAPTRPAAVKPPTKRATTTTAALPKKLPTAAQNAKKAPC